METFAAEHALGLLEGESLARAERLTAEDSDFAAVVSIWRERLVQMDLTASPISAGSELWERIAASVAKIKPVHTAVQASTAEAQRKPSFLSGLWRNLPVWRAAGIVGTATALSLALVLATTSRRSPDPIYIAVLMRDMSSPSAIVNTYPDGRAELIPLEPIVIPEDKALQVWTLWDRERGPVSVGLFDRARSARLDTIRLPRTGPDQLFEISLEPKQGSSTGRPTGPVLMKGLTHPAL